MNNIITSSDPYILDYIDGWDEVPALTVKNSNFIEAIVRLDSNYSKESDTIPCDKDFEPEKNYKDAKGRYCGSQKYWFKELENSKSVKEYKTRLLGAIISIDRANSTHLQASKDGRLEMRNRIIKKYDTVNKLKEVLSYGLSRDNELLKILTDKIDAEGKPGVRYNLSFATKFCSIASIELGIGDLYSKYDAVVSRALPVYSEIYFGEKVAKGAFKINSAAELQERLDIYGEYNKCIFRLLQEIKKDGIELDREKLDHIIWYGFKGNR